MWETKADEALVNVTTVVKLRPVVRPGLCDTTPPYPRCVHAGYQVHDSSVTPQVRSWLLVTNLLSIGQFNGWSCLRSLLEHRLLSVKSYLNTQRTEAKFWENKQEKAISFMTPLLLLLAYASTAIASMSFPHVSALICFLKMPLALGMVHFPFMRLTFFSPIEIEKHQTLNLPYVQCFFLLNTWYLATRCL